MNILSQASTVFMKRLASHRVKATANSLLKAASVITSFILNEVMAKRRVRSADLLVVFLRGMQRDSQIKKLAKKLKWVLLKLQKLIHERQVCNAAQAVMLGKKYETVVDKYLEEEAKKHEALLASAAKKARVGGKKGKGGAAPPPPEEKMHLEESIKNMQIKDWVIKNRQQFVTRLMAYEE